MLALVVMMFLAEGVVRAGTVSWDGGGDGSSWQDPDNWDTNSLPGVSDDAIISAGNTVTHSSGTTSINSLDCQGTLTFSGGTLSSSGDMTFTDTFNWTGGRMDGSGITTIPNGATMNISGSSTHKYLYGRTIENSGTVIFTGTKDLYMGDGAVFNNQATGLFDVQNNTYIFHGGGADTTFNNAGTFQKSAGSGISYIHGVSFSNIGTVEVQTGTLNITGSFPNFVGSTTLSSKQQTKCRIGLICRMLPQQLPLIRRLLLTLAKTNRIQLLPLTAQS